MAMTFNDLHILDRAEFREVFKDGTRNWELLENNKTFRIADLWVLHTASDTAQGQESVDYFIKRPGELFLPNVTAHNGWLIVIDGHHRLAAAITLGWDVIKGDLHKLRRPLPGQTLPEQRW
jgi:hypothetical protein